jgi:cobalt/nickel transport system permease protein
MRHAFLDRYSRLESPIHDLAAGTKLAAALILSLAVVLVPAGRSWFFSAVACFLVVVGIASAIPARFILKRLLLLEPVVLGIALLQLLRPNGGESFLLILVRSTLCLLTMILLSNTTPFAEILGVLQRVRLPWIFVTLLALMYRYLFVLVDEAERMERARRSRTFDRKSRRSWKSVATLVGQLFVRSSERAERVYAAMCARGWK